MNLSSKSRFAAGLCFLTLAAGAPAALHAQAPKIFVASFGNDLSDGSRGTPKRNFQAAHDAVADKGEIVALDTAGYGRLNISKSVSVVVPPGVNGFVTVGDGSSAITINAPATSTVTLRGLVIENNVQSGAGINAGGVGTLVVEDCVLRNFSQGIFFHPANSARLSMHRTGVRRCGIALDIETGVGAFSTTALVSRCRLEGNQNGLFALPIGGAVDVTATDCVITGSSNVAVSSTGSNSTVRVSNCTITDNASGAFVGNGGKLFSRGNNTLERNTNNNTFPGTFAAR